MKEEEVLAMLRRMLATLGSVATGAELPALAFLIGMAELEAAQTEAIAKRELSKKR